MNHSTIAVIGGTGKAGTYLVRQLLHQGYSLKLLLRNPAAFKHPFASSNPYLTAGSADTRIQLLQGDARDYASIAALVTGSQALISTLGQPKGEPPIFSAAATHIVRAMEQLGLPRYIAVTGLSIDLPADKKGPASRQASDYMRQLFPSIIADKQKEYELLSRSPGNWTLARVPLIVQTEERTSLTVSLEDCPGKKISATDLACWLIDQLPGGPWLRQAPFVANAEE